MIRIPLFVEERVYCIAIGVVAGEMCIRDSYAALRRIDELGAADSGSAGGADIRRIKGEIAASLRRAKTAIDAAAQADAEKVRTTRLRRFVTGVSAAEKIPAGFDDWVGDYFKALGAERTEE